jgi:ATP-dependent helicase/nuclease subunit B
MSAIDHEHLDFERSGLNAADRWATVAARAVAWADRRGVGLRDTIVLLPFAQLLPLARAAFGREGGWLPRIETTQTLARALGPPARPEPLQLALDRPADLLGAAQLLEDHAAGRDWARRDPIGFARAVSALVDTAQGLRRAAAAVPPEHRPAHWDRARSLLAPVSGPGATERMLARLALEWAALGVEPTTDRLFALRPAAWVVLQAGGADPLAAALLDHAPHGSAALVIDTDPSLARLFDGIDVDRAPGFVVCDGFEHEAQCAAAQVIRHVEQAEQPVALIAQDRLLVRRVRALLEQARLTLLDETGWTLSTTRAAAQLMALLRAARDDAGTDALFDWLKSLDAWPGQSDLATRVSALESACRRRQAGRIAALAGLDIEPWLAPFAAEVIALLRRLPARARMGVGDWLERLRGTLADSGGLASLLADEAGRQVLAALHLDVAGAARAEWLQSAGARAIDLDEFSAWVDTVFERASYRPAMPAPGTAQVVVTPLAQALCRPFAAIVLPGADDSHLGAPAAPHPLLSEAALQALGVPDATAQRSAEAIAFSHLLRSAPITLMRRRIDGTEPLADSPLVERLRLALLQRGAAFAAWIDPRLDRRPPAQPQRQPAPVAAGLLPSHLSASAAEALRACPYRFFALHLLRLREEEELEGEVEKRDYGSWLHAVLHDFHAGRSEGASREAEMQRLHEIGRASQARMGLDDAAFLPFAASFAAFVPRYVDWVRARDAAGAVWREAEREVDLPLAELEGVALRGVIDRVDTVRAAAGHALELIDYKTGSAEALKEKVRQPFEDTQLAFYAALLAPHADAPLQAMYLALDGRELKEIPHRDVERSAAALRMGLVAELKRVRAGAGLTALGEGATCDYCEARGLCRRDHWIREAES